MNVFLPSATPPNPDVTDLPTLQSIKEGCPVFSYAGGLKVYADALADTLNQWAEEQESSTRVSATGGIDEESGLAMVCLAYSRKVSEFKMVRFDSSVWKGLFDRFAEEQVVARHERQVIGFLERRMFYIVRPMSLMHWTRTAALNDADFFFCEETKLREADV